MMTPVAMGTTTNISVSMVPFIERPYSNRHARVDFGNARDKSMFGSERRSDTVGRRHGSSPDRRRIAHRCSPGRDTCLS